MMSVSDECMFTYSWHKRAVIFKLAFSKEYRLHGDGSCIYVWYTLEMDRDLHSGSVKETCCLIKREGSARWG